MNTPERSRRTPTVAGLVTVVCLVCRAAAGYDMEEGLKFRTWFDMGGTFGAKANLTEFAGPVSGMKLELDPGFQMDFGFDYRVTPWLSVGPELGLLFNSVDSFGEFSYHDTWLFQMPIMGKVTLEYPYAGRLLPYIGGGIGGVASALTFGDNGYYEPDGTGSDFVFGFQAFAGLRWRFTEHSSLGVVYRFLATDKQHWDVEWWNESHFHVASDSIQIHSVTLIFTASF